MPFNDAGEYRSYRVPLNDVDKDNTNTIPDAPDVDNSDIGGPFNSAGEFLPYTYRVPLNDVDKNDKNTTPAARSDDDDEHPTIMDVDKDGPDDSPVPDINRVTASSDNRAVDVPGTHLPDLQGASVPDTVDDPTPTPTRNVLPHEDAPMPEVDNRAPDHFLDTVDDSTPTRRNVLPVHEDTPMPDTTSKRVPDPASVNGAVEHDALPPRIDEPASESAAVNGAVEHDVPTSIIEPVIEPAMSPREKAKTSRKTVSRAMAIATSVSGAAALPNSVQPFAVRDALSNITKTAANKLTPSDVDVLTVPLSVRELFVHLKAKLQGSQENQLLLDWLTLECEDEDKVVSFLLYFFFCSS